MKDNLKSSCLGSATIILVTFVAYIPAIQGGFIWDDGSHVTRNLLLRSLDGLWKIWFEIGSHPQYYPLTLTGFWGQYQLWELNPIGYHIVNIFIHSLTSVFLWRVLLSLYIPGAWFAAVLFALHPVHVESVAWVSELKNVLSGFFYVASFLAAIKFFFPVNNTDGNSHISTTRSWMFYGTSLLLYVLALLSKTVTCSLPVALLIVIWWKRIRFDRRDLIQLSPFFVIGISFALLTTSMEQKLGAVGPEWDFSFIDRVLIAGRSLCFYIGKILCPQKIIFNYPQWNIDAKDFTQYFFPAIVLVSLTTLWFLRNRIGKGPLAAVLFFVITLFPALGFFDVYPMRFSFVADHFQYLASIGIIVLFAAVITICFGNRMPWAIRIIIIATIFILLGMKTWKLGYTYKNEEVLYTDILSKNPDSFLANNNLGKILFDRGQYEQSLKRFKVATQIKPYDAEGLNNIGSALLKLGMVEESFGYLEKAIKLYPKDVRIINTFTNTLWTLGRHEEAVEHAKTALHIDPNNVGNLNNLAWYLATCSNQKVRDGTSAVKLAEKACSLTAYERPSMLDTLAAAYAEDGRFNEAIEISDKAKLLAFSTNQFELGKEIESRNQLYRAFLPFHEKTR